MHQHSLGFIVGVFACFTFGAAINVGRNASSAVNSSLNGIVSYSQYFKRYGWVQATKTFTAFFLLLFWLWHQTSTVGVIALFWPGGTVPQWLQGILVVSPATAGAFGLFFDVLEDFAIVYLKKIAPQLFPPEVPPTIVSAIVKEQAKQ